MKDQITLIMKTSILPVLACIAAVTIFTACEPEGVEDQIVEMDLKTGIQAKAATPALLKKELALLRATVAPWHDFDTAFEAGYNLEVTGYRSQMGFHYLNPGLLDDTFEISKPELLLFVPGPNGKLRFVGVEYAVPVLSDSQPAPEGFSGDADQWVINTEFNLWVLHVWVGLNNPDGIFASHNPRIP